MDSLNHRRPVKRSPREKVWIFAAISALGAVGFLMRFKVVLHSDTLYFWEFINSLKSNAGGFSDWRMAPAQGWFPDLFFYYVSTFFTSDARQQIFLVSYFQWALLIAASLCLFYLIRTSWSTAAWISFVGFLAVASVVIFGSDYWFLLHQNTIHFAAVGLPLIQLALLFALLRPMMLRRRTVVVFSALSFFISILGASSTSVYVLTWTIPACLVTMWLAVKFWRSNLRSRSMIMGAAFAASTFGTLLGFYIQRKLTFNSPLLNRVGSSRGEISASFSSFLDAVSSGFNTSNLLTLASMISVLFAMFFMGAIVFISGKLEPTPALRLDQQFKVGFRSNLLTLVLASFALLSFGSSLLGSIATSGFKDIWGFRYVVFGGYLLCLWAVLYVLEMIDRNRTTFRNRIASGLSGFSFLVVVLLAFLSVSSALGFSNVGSRFGLGSMFPTATNTPAAMGMSGGPNEFEKQNITNCVMSAQTSGVNLENGVAEYWSSRILRYQSGGQIQISPFLGDLTPFFWLNSKADFYPENGKFNWVLIDPDGASPFNFTRESLSGLLPNPAREIDCGGGNVILVYEGSELDNVIRAKVHSWSKADWING